MTTEQCPGRMDTTEANHCWHRLPISLTTNPPISIYQCCFCGQQKREQTFEHDDWAGHGKYRP